MKRVTNLSDSAGTGERLWKGTRPRTAFEGRGELVVFVLLPVLHLLLVMLPTYFLHLQCRIVH
jgi:hypothetical protein